jgi:hypothetical protein
LTASEIVPLLFLGNITDAIEWRGALIPCLFEEGSLREEALEALLDRIHRYRGDGVPVLVHCENGIDRSPTIVMHYLVRKLGMSQEDAIKLIKEKRPVANPHPEWEIKKSIMIVDDEFLKQQTHLGAWIIPEEDRIYLSEIKHPEKLPKQLPVYEGPRGGRFISRRDLRRLGVKEEEIGVERKPSEEPEEERVEEPSRKVPVVDVPRGYLREARSEKELLSKLMTIEGLTRPPKSSEAQDYKYLADEIIEALARIHGFDSKTARFVSTIFSGWDSRSYVLGRGVINLFEAASEITGRPISKYVLEDINGIGAHPRFGANIRDERAKELLKRIILFNKSLMRRLFGDRDIVVYRGVPKKDFSGKRGIYKLPCLSSWTPDLHLAKKYAGEEGVVLKAVVKPEDVGVISSIYIPKVTAKWKGLEFTLITDKDLKVEVIE